MIITTALNYDTFFYNQMLVLLASLETNSPNDIIDVRLVDFPERKVKKLKEEFPKYYFSNVNLQVNKMDNLAGFMVCYRSAVIYDALTTHRTPVAWMDCDIIVRKELNPLWQNIESNQFKIIYRGNDVPIKNRFQAGIFVIGFSNSTRNMIADWKDRCIKSNKWFADQKLLYNVYEKYVNKIEFIHMDRSLNDVGDSTKECFLDDSVIWHCKRSHFNNLKFQKEFKYYLNKTTKRLNK